MKMRIVAMNSKSQDIFIQIFNNGKWEQIKLTCKQFTNFMKKHFPNDYMKYQNIKEDENIDICNYFYHYNEDEKMIRKGIAFVFES